MADSYYATALLGAALCLMTSLLSQKLGATPTGSPSSAHPSPYCRGLTPGATTVAHPDFCHRYFDCTEPGDGVNVYHLAPYERECPYLTLYDEVKGQCLPFTEVTCHGRLELKDPCDYSAYQCHGPNCRPCSIEKPSCVGYSDGKMYWPGREDSGFWVQCQSEYVTSHGQCEMDVDGAVRLFSMETSQCLRYNDMISTVCLQQQQHGSLRSLWAHETDCRSYYDCGHAHATPTSTSRDFVVTCPGSQLFDVASQRCEDFTKVTCEGRRKARTL